MHFIAKIVLGQGPDPVQEIEALVATSAAHEKGHVVFGMRRSVKRQPRESVWGYALVFTQLADGTLDGFAARIIHPRATAPDPLPPVYVPFAADMKSWWTLKDARRLKRGLSIVDLPGHSATGKRAETTFIGQAPFAYWVFSEDPRDTVCSV